MTAEADSFIAAAQGIIKAGNDATVTDNTGASAWSIDENRTMTQDNRGY